jgi:hypothetical protein
VHCSRWATFGGAQSSWAGSLNRENRGPPTVALARVAWPFWRVGGEPGGGRSREHHRDGGTHLGGWIGEQLTDDGPPWWRWSGRQAQRRQRKPEGDDDVWWDRRLHTALVKPKEVAMGAGRGRQSSLR